MNSSNENFGFTGGWQDDYLADYSGSSFDDVSNRQVETSSDFQEAVTASLPDHWLTTHAPWLQHGSAYGGPSTADVDHPRSFPSYTAAQDHAYTPGLTDLSDIDQCQFHSSFSESELDQLYTSHFGGDNSWTQNCSLIPIPSPSTDEFPQHPQPTAYTSQASLPTSYPNTSQPSHQTSNPRLTTNETSPTDPLHPRPQPPRWLGDLYTPTYVRGEANTRAGWCRHCNSWLTLKDSAYWYHMHFAHGISCSTGAHLPNPVQLRPSSSAARGVGDAEALCGGCQRWISVVMGEKGRTAWFRHAYRCLLKAGAGRERKGGRGGEGGSPRKVAARPAT